MAKRASADPSPDTSSDPSPDAALTTPAPPPDLEKLKRYFTEARQLTELPRMHSLQAIDYYDSDQFTPKELADFEKRHQPPIVVNRIKPAVNGILGVTQRARSDPKAWPREPEKADQADVATDVLRFVADENRFKAVKSDCFLDMLVPGTMALMVGVDVDLRVTLTQVRWEEFFGDPRSRRRDWADARFLGIAKWMYADDAAALWPQMQASIQATVNAGTGGGILPDQSYADRPLQGSATGGAWVDQRQRRLMVVEMYYRETSWKRAVFTVTDILEAGPSPYLDAKRRPECPILAQSAYVRRDNGRYGVVWDMIPIQDEINKRRSKALHHLMVSRVQMKDPMGTATDADVVRQEATRPDGVLPMGWEMAPSAPEFAGNIELLQEAKAEMERMAPNPAMIGRDGQDSSGRALLARQQAGLIELTPIYTGLEDWERRVYRACWARVKQYWRAPQFVRVTDDENAPRFVGVNQPVTQLPLTDPASGQPLTHPQTGQPMMSPPQMQVGLHPQTGQPMLTPKVLGYRNTLAEMDVDIEVDAQPDNGTIAQEQFSELMQLIGSNPQWQQQVPLTAIIKLSSIPHKQSVLDQIEQAQQASEQKAQVAQGLQAAHLQAKTHEAQASALEKTARGQATMINALTEAHALHADQTAAGFEAGVGAARDANATQQRIQSAAIQNADALNGGAPMAPQAQ